MVDCRLISRKDMVPSIDSIIQEFHVVYWHVAILSQGGKASCKEVAFEMHADRMWRTTYLNNGPKQSWPLQV